jgi:mannose-6-phosphate isomerase-like protein (cupin superfamily)
MRKWVIGAAALAACAATAQGATGQAAPGAAPMHVTTKQLDKMTETVRDGVAATVLPLGDDAPMTMTIRRTKTGEAEVHEALNDTFMVRAGRAAVLVGGTLTGQRQTGPGEWRGGTISGATRYEVGPGDMVWIPAGLPHQVIVPAGRSFSYAVVKTRK